MVENIRILLAIPFDYSNKGDICVLNSMLSILSIKYPKAKMIVFVVNPKDFNMKYYSNYNIKFVKYMIPWSVLGSIWAIIMCIMWIFLNKILKNKFEILWNNYEALNEYNKSDIVIYPSRDLISSTYNVSSFISDALFSIMVGILFKKPTMIYAAQIGPFDDDFKGRLSAVLSSLLLNKVNIITVRDRISRVCLQEIGVSQPQIFLTADPAFLLESSPSDVFRHDIFKDKFVNMKLIIGINTSGLIYTYGFPDIDNILEKKEKYTYIMSQLIDYLILKYDAIIILLPHVFEISDDKLIANEIYNLVKWKDRVTLIEEEIQPEEIRAIIGLFDIFITTRFHPLIHSLSMCIPTLAIDYSFKMKSLMEELTYDKYWYNILYFNLEELIFKIDNLIYNKNKIKKNICNKIEKIKERSRLNVELINGLFEM